MFCKVALTVVLLGSSLVSCTHDDNNDASTYRIPEPIIQVFSPQGLKVSVPHASGIELFAFHGNINKPMEGIPAGQLSKDITQRDGGRWVFEDPSIRLKIGDKIYYWLFVIRDNLGYRYDNAVFEVKDITPRSVAANGIGHNNYSHAMSSCGNEKGHPEKNDINLRICERVVLNLTQTLLDLKYEADSLRESNEILRDMVEKHPETARTLYLDGRMPADEDPVFVVQQIVRQKLKLPITIEGAKRTKDRIRFEVSTINDKISIILAAKKILQNSMFAITY